MIAKHICTVLALACVLMLGACGFHRQGTAPMPEIMRRTYIESADALSEFRRGLKTALQTSGVEIVAKRDEATTLLLISKEETGRRVLSVSARNTPREYEIFYTVVYSVVANGKEVLPSQELSLTRDFSFDEQALLAKEQEEEILRAALARDLVGIVMRRLSRL